MLSRYSEELVYILNPNSPWNALSWQIAAWIRTATKTQVMAAGTDNEENSSQGFAHKYAWYATAMTQPLVSGFLIKPAFGVIGFMPHEEGFFSC